MPHQRSSLASRREFVLAASACLGSCAGGELGGGYSLGARPALGVDTWSESASLVGISTSGEKGFSVRLCRYPDVGVSWLWATVFDAPHVYAYSQVDLPCERDHTDLDAKAVRYGVRTGAASIWIDRHGPRSSPVAVRMRAALPMRATARVGRATGPHHVGLSAEFVPLTVNEGMLEGRTELKGVVNATVTINGREERLTVGGHFHEQPQPSARWTEPFVYASGWGRKFSFTVIRGVRSSGGYMFRDRRAEKVIDFVITRPAALRALRMVLESGAVIQGSMRTTLRYDLRIYDDWRNSEVSVGAIDERGCVATINDWLGRAIRYDAPT